jgi:hypothetical protein
MPPLPERPGPQQGPLTLVVSPTLGRPGRFDGVIGDRLLVSATRQPLLDGARVLLELGFDPRQLIAMRHADAGFDALRGTIAAAAAVTVEERLNGPAFRPWRETPPRPLVAGPPITPQASEAIGHRSHPRAAPSALIVERGSRRALL